MGGFYTSYTLRGVSQRAVAAALAGREAFVSASRGGYVVAFDKESDNQDQEAIAALASGLSKKLDCCVLAALVHDDDVFWYQLHESGQLADEYDSCPNYWGTLGPKPLPPSGGSAARLCAAFQAGDPAAVEAILRKGTGGKGRYVFASDQHLEFVRALGLPELAVLNAYAGLMLGEYPEGFEELDLQHCS